MIIGRNYYEESQKLFSTGNEDLDAILEEVYYSGIEDGYDYAQKEFAEAKLKFSDRMDVNRLKGTYAGKNGEKYKESHLKQADPDPEVRNAELKKVQKEHLKNSAKLAAVAVPVSAAIGAGLGKAAGVGAKETALYYAGAAGVGTAAGTIGGQVGIGIAKAESKRAANGNEKAQKSIRKTRDEVLLASGKMTKEEFVKKWGGKIDGKKIKGSENE